MEVFLSFLVPQLLLKTITQRFVINFKLFDLLLSLGLPA